MRYRIRSSPTGAASGTAVWTLPRSMQRRPSCSTRVVEARIPDRGRPHVHAAAPGPEVEGGADDGDGAGGFSCGNVTGGRTSAAGSGEGRNRTGDTTVFSRVLYRLSYLAAAAEV